MARTELVEVTALRLLGGDIVGIVRVGGHVMCDPFGNPDPSRFQSGDLVGIIGQQPDLVDAQLPSIAAATP
jgi:hypothetical protein